MTKSDHDEFDLDWASGMIEAVFSSFIEDGTIRIGDRPSAEIMVDFIIELKKMLDAPVEPELHAVLDYRSTLLQRAQAEIDLGNDYIAVTLYATWVEHFLNGILSLMLRRQGRSIKTINLLLRELRIATKVTALWEIAKLPPLADEHVKLLDKVTNFRNSFIHYKWAVASEAEINSRHERLREVVEGMAAVIEVLHAIELAEIWNDRKDELVERLHMSVEEREREVRPFSEHLRQTGEPAEE